MLSSKKVRIIEPRGRPARPLNSWIARWPLLGPIILATILHERGFDAAAYNENISGPVNENPEAYEDICSADVVGISIMTPTASRGYAIADRIRQDSPGVKIVFGGVHATFMPEEALEHGDIVVRGEGENIIESIALGEIDSGIIKAPPVADLDTIPTLNHFLLRDFDKILAVSRKRYLYELPVMTSRGCPHGCTYCSVTQMFGRKVRRQSVGKVYRDLCRYADQGFRHLFFYDDNFTSDRDWTRQLLERLRPLRMSFNAQTRVDFHWMDRKRRKWDRAMLQAMRRAGGNALYIGYETIDDLTARQWHKGYQGASSLKVRLQEDTRILHDHGFWIHGMFVMGPQHTKKTADQIVDFAHKCDIESLQISILTPFPGTPLFEQMRAQLVLNDFPGDWDYYDGVHCVYDHGSLGLEGLQNAVVDAHRRFYLWGGWNSRAVRLTASRPISFTDKLMELWYGARTARTMLQKWGKDTKTFLELVKARNEAY